MPEVKVDGFFELTQQVYRTRAYEKKQALARKRDQEYEELFGKILDRISEAAAATMTQCHYSGIPHDLVERLVDDLAANKFTVKVEKGSRYDIIGISGWAEP